MTNKEILLEEYRSLRKEITERIKILHGIINLSGILIVVFALIAMLTIQYLGSIFYTFLLSIPLVFTGLIFNYQDNQRTLEAIARYLEETHKGELKTGVSGWELYFAEHKKKYQFSSSAKLFLLFLPFLIPILLLIYCQLADYQVYMALIDLFLLFLVIANFRYKLNRIKVKK